MAEVSSNQPTRRQMLGVSLGTAFVGFLGGARTAGTLARLARSDLVSMTQSYEGINDAYVTMWIAIGSNNLEFYLAAMNQNPELARIPEGFLRTYLNDAVMIKYAISANPYIRTEKKVEFLATIDDHVAAIESNLSKRNLNQITSPTI